ncbi:MAG: amino acid ABC transporter substrate-binding protein [Microbacterium sp. SCN 70-200]|uniref:substrate-binding domain-containing protein n=1 Tax=unclassified Microbacterium TaxID=2609290 RepID=UPI00086B7E2B|nr:MULTISPECIES: substrate-binding domain-containing protein [unclassified Microbacterium]MBN9214471.1 substrate-binding domain-containing protein [Microbacterium sp.]ODT40812.1 MAG: amino acid ABC transporter substrate-binding protein [Microbacterium sp. SCN 70-200]OJV84143.1 MAG: amino acid ABC transporter substrate-binding protein [Microbacterium sp. 70-16]
MRVTQKLLPKAGLVGVVVATAALVLSACAPQASTPDLTDSEAAGPAEITVGVITSETGALAGYGKQYLDGFKAGLDYATDGTNEVDGTKIVIDYRDDAGDPDTAVGAAKELIGSGVTILAGSASSGVAAAVAEQAGQNKVLFISGPAAADALTGINDYTFRSGRQTAQDVATAGTFLGDIEGKKITVFAQNTAFGQGNVAAVEAILGAKGATVDSVLVAEDVTEFTPFAQQVLAGSPDLVFVAWAGATSGAMWQAMSQQGVFDAVPVVTGLGDAATFGAYGEASEQISFLNYYFPGAPDNAVNTAMVDAVEAAGGTPDLFTPDGFNAALMLVHAISEGKGDVDAMIAALEGYTFDGPKGSLTVRAGDHALLQEMYQAKLVADGDTFTPELVETVPADEVEPAEVQ